MRQHALVTQDIVSTDNQLSNIIDNLQADLCIEICAQSAVFSCVKYLHTKIFL